MKLIDILVEELPKRGGWPEGVCEISTHASGRVFFDGRFAPRGFSLPMASDAWNKYKDPCSYTNAVTREQYEAALAAKNEGWIDWPGGECPVEKGTLVDVRYRDSQTYPDRIGTPALVDGGYGATYHHWLNDGMRNDIIAYRLHQPQEAAQPKTDDEADLNECIGQDAVPVWNGEGLPPVGCEFEYGSHRTKAKCLAVAHHMVFASKGNPDDEESDYEEFMISILDSEFHPVRTEAERKREKAIAKITDAICGEIPDTGMATAAKYAARAYDAIAEGKIKGVKLED